MTEIIDPLAVAQTTRIQFGDGLNVTDQGGGIIRVDGAGLPATQGVQWDDIGTTYGSQHASYGSTPPVSPSDGDLWYFPADAAGTVWAFRYNSSSASAYKWEYIGGSPLHTTISTGETTTVVNTWVDLATVGPGFLIPRSGEYLAWGDAIVSHSVANTACWLGLAVTNNIPFANLYAGGGSNVGTVVSIQGKAAFVAGDYLKMRYFSNGAGTFSASWRQLTMQPVRVA